MSITISAEAEDSSIGLTVAEVEDLVMKARTHGATQGNHTVKAVVTMKGRVKKLTVEIH